MMITIHLSHQRLSHVGGVQTSNLFDLWYDNFRLLIGSIPDQACSKHAILAHRAAVDYPTSVFLRRPPA